MAEPRNFLERWSRRKHAANAAEATAKPTAAPASQSVPPEALVEPEPPRAPEQPAASEPAAAAAFDLSKLPSLDTITATTDVRAFLTPGVPPELTRAALRRAWETDPAIRNFVGLQEYDWDFNNPAAGTGFGALPPDIDVPKMIAELLGKRESAPATPSAADTPPEPQQNPSSPIEPQISPAAMPATAAEKNDEAEPDNIVQSNKDIATQNVSARKHGGAIPQ